ncbi:MAG TPA: ATP-dependent Clp protease proteolytic subunit [Acidimicrobiales bacterium]|nr:ATP-dependent Clp protease proteolytic subunit [Acidimicrobiales bacterium]
MSEEVRAALFARRVVMVAGPVDLVRAGEVAAELLTLDALGDDPVRLRLEGHSGSLDAAFSLMDVIDSMGVPVHVTCSGSVSGTLVGILAVAERREIAPHARLRLCEPEDSFGGRAVDVAARVAHEQKRLEAFQRRLAERTNRPLEHIEADMQIGRFLSAEDAVAYGLADAVSG